MKTDANSTRLSSVTIYLIIKIVLAGMVFIPVSSVFSSMEILQVDNLEKDCIDCPTTISAVTDRSLRLDADGHPHIAYGKDHLYYAWHDGAAWHKETVDQQTNVGSSASLALDADGKAHISYSNWENHDLKYAHQTTEGWSIESIDTIGNVGDNIAVAVDDSNCPHIVYSQYQSDDVYEYSGELRYAYQNGGVWIIGTIDAGANVGRSSLSMDLDPDGYPHVIYFHMINGYQGFLRYAYLDAGGWHIQEMSSVFDNGRDASMVVDDLGFVHTSYQDSVNFDLMYAYQTASGWFTETVETTGDTGYKPALEMDGSGYPVISYFSQDDVPPLPRAVKLANKNVDGWHIETITSVTYNLDSTSLGVDADGDAHIIYYDGGYILTPGPYQLIYAQHVDGETQTEVIDDAGDVGYYLSTALDSQNRVHTAYYDVKNRALKYAYEGTGGWQVETVDERMDTGKYPSIAIDADDFPHITYYDDVDTKLWYAYRDINGWNFIDLANYDWSVFKVISSLKIDSNGYSHIICGALNDAVIRHLYQNGSGWHTEQITIGTGTDVSLAIDKNDNLHVSYQSNGLKYAYNDGTGWHLENVDTSSNESGKYSSIALDSAGMPRIGYFRSWTSIKYAYRDESGWHTETVDTIGSASHAISIAVDKSDYSHMVYGDVLDTSLWYAYQDAEGWQIQMLDGTGGWGKAIAIDSLDIPHIVYTGTADNHLLIQVPSLPPASPNNLTATAFTQSQINLTWNDNSSDESDFHIERSTDGSTSWVEIGTSVTPSYSNTDLSCGTLYYYRVLAHRHSDDQYSNSYSNFAYASTQSCDPPVSPTDLAASAVSQSQINISWNDTSFDESDFHIERSPNGSSSWIEIATSETNTYFDTGLSCGTSYYYRVRAHRHSDDQFSANYSNIANATTQSCPIPPPASPTNLAAFAVSQNQIDLSWNDTSFDESDFHIERSIDGSTSWIEIDTSTISNYSNTDLSCGSLYYYRVRAHRHSDDMYSTDYSNIANATTQACPIPPPAYPTDLSATAVSQSQINLSWSDNSSDESDFHIERSPNGSSSWVEISTSLTPSYSSIGLSCETPYYYRVRAHRHSDDTYSPDYSNIANATTQSCPISPTYTLYLPLLIK